MYMFGIIEYVWRDTAVIVSTYSIVPAHGKPPSSLLSLVFAKSCLGSSQEIGCDFWKHARERPTSVAVMNIGVIDCSAPSYKPSARLTRPAGF